MVIAKHHFIINNTKTLNLRFIMVLSLGIFIVGESGDHGKWLRREIGSCHKPVTYKIWQ
jgi:hypothetical protein